MKDEKMEKELPYFPLLYFLYYTLDWAFYLSM